MEDSETSHNFEIKLHDDAKIKMTRSKKLKIIKGSIIGLLILSVSINCLFGIGFPHGDIECMEDYAHQLTEPINTYLHKNETLRDLILIFGSFYMDCIVIGIGVFWALKCKSWRYLATTFTFYIFRGLVQQTFQMNYPEGYMWDYPGFPSLTVSYLKTNDFFFSGHVGLPVIAALELNKNGRNIWAIVALCGSFVEFVIMIIMRGHYIIDMITGMIIAHYIFILVDKYIYIVDDSRFSLKDDDQGTDVREISNFEEDKEKGITNVRNIN